MARRLALIMAGGGGARLWPASTAQRPKQLVDPQLAGRSLLRRTVERLAPALPPGDIWVVTTQEQRASIVAALPEVPAQQIIAEPFPCNTAPCVALAAAVLEQHEPDATLIVLPADHHVADPAGFRALLECACIHAEHGNAIVTLGIEPTHAATGFGYLQRQSEPLPALPGDGENAVFSAKRFVEKPDEAHARDYLESGDYLWNAGIFVMPLRRIASELAAHCSEVWRPLVALGPVLRSATTGDLPSLARAAFELAVPESLDVAVMEKLADLRVVPARVGWTDLGSWAAVFDLAPKDKRGNACISASAPPPVLLDTENSMVWAESMQVALIGTTGLAVIQSGEKILVCPLDRAQQVRTVVDTLRQRGELGST